MTIAIVLFAIMACSLLYALFSAQKAKEARVRLAEVEAGHNAVQSKLADLRKELSTTKEELVRRTKALEEARDVAKRKLRKEGQKASQMQDDVEVSASQGNEELERLQKAYAALEMQLRAFTKDSEKALTDARHMAQQEVRGAVEKLSDENSKLTKELKDLRHQQRSKREATLQKAAVDVASLPADVQDELARLLRKSEHYERAQALSQGKYQMAQERYGELQRRYFAVCRELALALGQDAAAPDEAVRHTAETVLEAADSTQVH